MVRLSVLFTLLAAYLATTGLILWGLHTARERVIADMSEPASLEGWHYWAEETRRTPEPDQPVARRAIKSEEPPALILMRDHFGSIQAVSLAVGSFLFAFLVFLTQGIWRQRRDPSQPAGVTDPPS